MTGLAALGLLAWLPLASIIRGFALKILWGWFIVPLGFSTINIPLAIGIGIVVGMLTHENPKKEKQEISEMVLGSLLIPFILLFFGWIVQLFI